MSVAKKRKKVIMQKLREREREGEMLSEIEQEGENVQKRKRLIEENREHEIRNGERKKIMEEN